MATPPDTAAVAQRGPSTTAGRQPPGRARSWALAVPPLLVAVVATAVLFAWGAQGRHAPSGDEPHYLVAARGLTAGSVEQSGLYAEAYRDRWYYDLWPPPGTPPTPKATHTFQGPHGLYSVHNLGLPALLSAPTRLAGVPGARLTMVAVVAVAAWLAAVTAYRSRCRPWRAALVGTSLVCSAPFLPAAGQIYPDIPAGVLFLAGCLALLQRESPRLAVWAPALTTALLPWLQIKFGVLALVLGLALLTRTWHSSGSLSRFSPLLIPAVSLAGLLVYNRHAFADVAGPYGEGALDPGSRALQTALGLVLDQDQGLLFQNPLLLVTGVAGLATLYRRDRLVAVTVAVGAASVLVLNALHTHWYGGFSFVGRFMWTSATVLLLPSGLFLAHLWQRRAALVPLLLVGNALLQVHLWRLYTLSPAVVPDLYQRQGQPLLVAYSVYWHQVAEYLPALYAPAWAWRYPPNLLWPAALLLLLALSARARRVNGRRAAVAAGAVVLSTTALVAVPPPPEAQRAAVPPSAWGPRAGERLESGLLASAGQHPAEFLSTGPGAVLPPGDYSADVDLSADVGVGVRAATIDVTARAGSGGRVAPPAGAAVIGPLPAGAVTIPFRVVGEGRAVVDVRVWWHGVGRVELRRITLRVVSP